MGIMYLITSWAALFCLVMGTPQDDAEIACGSNQPMVLTELSGTIESRGFPFQYPLGEDCTWLISAPDVPDDHQLHLVVEFLATISDPLRICEGDNDDGFPVVVLDGVYELDVITLTTKEDFLNFVSGGNIVANGFRIHYEYSGESPVQNGTELACDPDTMPFTLHLKDGLIESLHYPHRYSPLDCQWDIDVPEEHAPYGLYVSALSFRTFDEMFLHEGADNSGELIGEWVGSETGTTFNSSSSELFLDFVPKLYNPWAHGFQFAYYPVDPACVSDEGVVIEIPDDGDQEGVIHSPGYPYVVPEHSRCRWTIIAPDGTLLTLTSTIIHLQESEECEQEYLEITDGGDDGISLGRFCGHTTFGSIPSPSGTMQLELKTHDQPNGQPVAIGFSVEYNAE